MKKLVTLLLVAVLLTGCTVQNGGNSTTPSSKEETEKTVVSMENTIDGETYTEKFTKVPERVISASGFTTEMLLALGLGDKIVGYSYMDNEIYPEFKEEFSKLNNLSDTLPSKETILALEPDFITGWASTFSEENYTKEFCQQNGMQIYVPQVEYAPATMEKVYEDFTNFGKIFQVEERANEIIEKIKNQVADTVEKVEGKEKKKVFVYDSGEDECFTASAGLPTELIELAGGENVFKEKEKNWMAVSWESVVESEPDAILVIDYLGSGSVEDKIEFLKNKEALKEMKAIKEEKIFTIGLTDVTGGIRNGEAVQEIARNLHPELFQ